MIRVKKMIIIDRINKEFDCVVCLNTSLPEHELFDRVSYDKLIAADGAASELYQKNIYPDIVIGDFDSINPSDLKEHADRTLLIHDKSQDTNDFEKILNYCIDNNLRNLLILGIHGGELEHTINNLSVLLKYNKKLELVLYDSERMGRIMDEDCIMQTLENETISLIPMPYCKLTTKNLKWELENDILKLGTKEGARNIAISTEIEIKVHEGCFILFNDFD